LNVFYEEDGGFKVGAVMADNGSSLQVEAAHGKRSKIKVVHVLLKFDLPLAGFMEQAQAESEKLDVDFLWQCCGEDEFGFEALAVEYYGHAPSPLEAAAVALRLHSVPMYFYRKGKGRYKAAPEENLKAALAAQERKRLQALKVAEYVEQLKAHRLPPEFKEHLGQLLYEPDKNSLEYKALDEAATACGMLHLKLLESCGALPSAHDYHLGAFMREHFPAGVDFPAHPPLVVPDDLPQADVQAFSIDDATTTEIDDAFSVTLLPNGNKRVGIHIAAPALGILPGTELDAVVLQRLSTVYMPGHKITMLPEAAIVPFSLNEGLWRPALSLYLEITPALEVVGHQSRTEVVKVADNLRHDTLEPHFNENTIAQDGSSHPYWDRLVFLHQVADSLEKARGKHDPNRATQVDYSFYVEDGKVRIAERRRGVPMDKLVAELMIYANTYWGGLLAQNDIPGIYRAQSGGKVYMTVNAEPHQGLGVAQYAWSTSPLRRAVDLINQRQTLALLNGTAPPYAKTGEELAVAMRDFDHAHNSYNEFQNRMERYWCLRWLMQEQMAEVSATVWRENLVRLDGMPYISKVPSLPELAPGSRVQLKVERIDPLLMELECRFLTRLE